MQVLGISGSPRKGGNCEMLLQRALRPFREKGWETVECLLSVMTVAPCDGCDGCEGTGRCVLCDDMDAVYAAFQTCQAVIIASPVYYRNVSAQLKAVFDRSYALRNRRPLEGKPGGAIAVGRGTGGGQSLVLAVIYNFLLSSGAVAVPGEMNGMSAVADRPGDIARQLDRLRQAEVLGENVLRLAQRTARP
jgi:multimeric flavodoxin WrbA